MRAAATQPEDSRAHADIAHDRETERKYIHAFEATGGNSYGAHDRETERIDNRMRHRHVKGNTHLQLLRLRGLLFYSSACFSVEKRWRLSRLSKQPAPNLEWALQATLRPCFSPSVAEHEHKRCIVGALIIRHEIARTTGTPVGSNQPPALAAALVEHDARRKVERSFSLRETPCLD